QGDPTTAETADRDASESPAPADTETPADEAEVSEPQAGSSVESSQVEPQAADSTPPTSAEAGSWVGRVEALSKEILLGRAGQADADALWAQLVPKLQAAQTHLRDSLAKEASSEILTDEHRVMEDLYAARILLLQEISAARRARLTGWSADGVREAGVETDRLQLHMRHQGKGLPAHVSKLISDLRTSPVPFLKGLLYIFLAVIIFRGWRAWARRALPETRQRLINARPRSRRNLRLAKLIWYFDRLRAPIEWLVMAALVVSVIKPGLGLIDEEPLFTVIRWIFIGWFGLSLVNSIAARGGAGLAKDSSGLRTRSLKLLWSWIALFGMSLQLAEEFVGRGTLHSWTWWIVAILGLPVLLLILRWWRDEVVRRAEQESQLPSSIVKQVQRSKSKKSYVATAVIGGYLMLRSAQRRALRLVSRSEFGRRVLAHIFRREVARQAETQNQDDGSSPISEELQEEILSSQHLMQKIYRAQVRSLVDAASQPGATSIVVGDRGVGKTTLLRRLDKELGNRVLYVDCPPGGLDDFIRAFSSQLGLEAREEPRLRLKETVKVLKERGIDIIAIDNFHRLVRPAMGGMRDIDRLTELLDQLGRGLSRIAAIDSAAWLYFRRARQDRLVLDQVVNLQPWSESEIGELLVDRAREVGIDPDYERLHLPRQLDEIVYEVEQDRKRFGFFRVLWDLSDGVPAVALRLWCEALRLDADGDVFVRIFPQRDVSELEDLNLASKFVLRAISQMEYANTDQIVDALRLNRRDVDVAIRFLLVQGYLDESNGYLHVTWPWYRNVRRLLARQNLLVLNG
ncbi:MAG: ATP-binding protein, partial [Acidobacteriota bacterium]